MASSSTDEVADIDFLADFLQKHGTAAPSMGETIDTKRTVLEKCRRVLLNEEQRGHFTTALSCIKILSREKQNLEDLIDETLLELLLSHARIHSDKEMPPLCDQDMPAIYEAQRCLNNLLLQSELTRAICSKNGMVDGIMNLIMHWKVNGIPVDLLIFDLKLFFLITALCPETRKVAYLDKRGVSRLTSLLGSVINHAKERELPGPSKAAGAADTTRPVLQDNEVDLIGEGLKTLFNITLNVEEESMDEEEESHMKDLSDTLHSLFTISTTSQEKKFNLHSNCTNLLSNIPMKMTHPLVQPLKKDIVSPDLEDIEYDGVSMNVPRAMMDLLMSRIDNPESSLRESITPVLSVLCSLSRFHRPIRKYLRAEILPPLRDMTNRPEVGNKARNKLCKLLTSPVDAVSSMVAELLFILCKESVARLVKYTGYGNAAGLLARRGLMLGGKGSDAGDYSDEEDSETEEYAENAHKINPIVGCVEPTRPSPFEGMSDEQKEYEAMKLVNLINDLQNVGVVKPAIPGPDGKPQAVEHVLQLQEAAERLRGGSGTEGARQGDDEEDSD